MTHLRLKYLKLFCFKNDLFFAIELKFDFCYRFFKYKSLN